MEISILEIVYDIVFIVKQEVFQSCLFASYFIMVYGFLKVKIVHMTFGGYQSWRHFI